MWYGRGPTHSGALVTSMPHNSRTTTSLPRFNWPAALRPCVGATRGDSVRTVNCPMTRMWYIAVAAAAAAHQADTAWCVNQSNDINSGDLMESRARKLRALGVNSGVETLDCFVVCHVFSAPPWRRFYDSMYLRRPRYTLQNQSMHNSSSRGERFGADNSTPISGSVHPVLLFHVEENTLPYLHKTTRKLTKTPPSVGHG